MSVFLSPTLQIPISSSMSPHWDQQDDLGSKVLATTLDLNPVYRTHSRRKPATCTHTHTYTIDKKSLNHHTCMPQSLIGTWAQNHIWHLSSCPPKPTSLASPLCSISTFTKSCHFFKSLDYFLIYFFLLLLLLIFVVYLNYCDLLEGLSCPSNSAPRVLSRVQFLPRPSAKVLCLCACLLEMDDSEAQAGLELTVSTGCLASKVLRAEVELLA